MNSLADKSLEKMLDQSYQLDPQQLTQLMEQLDNWQIDRSTPEPQLMRQFKFKNFNEALDFTNQVGELAEQVDHHPSILLEWGKVTVRWWTHSIGGLHLNDFILAARTDQVFTAT
ncbi:MAG: 4a-hydroxytetrahydrobiopterin dehydratase [Gammaproteobacteria bacterium]|nr:4a-hydroxytetrahydrobiopterin dehydratase [Gammaproteobacteria bacterium]